MLAPFLLLITGTADITKADISKHVAYLCSPQLGGRMTAGKGEELAAAYLSKKLTAYGLKPLNGKSGFLHTFPVGLLPGPNAGSMLRFQGKPNFAAKVQSDYLPVSGTSSKPAEGQALFVGYGGKEAYSNVDAKGRIVILLEGVKSGPSQALNQKVNHAKAAGAVGVLFVRKKGVTELNKGERVPGYLNMPAAAISYSFASKVLGSDPFLSAKTRSLGCKVRIDVGLEPRFGKGRNIIAGIPGKDPSLKSQYIFIAAHYDHLGFGEVGSMSRSSAMHPGADDNASGTAALLEVARELARSPLRRTVVLAFLSGEELGLEGSKFWVHDHPGMVSKTVAMLNLDMVGRLEAGRRINVFGTSSAKEWPAILNAARIPNLDYVSIPAISARTDCKNFAKHKVPVLSLTNTLHPDYHTERDTPDKLNYDGIVKVTRAVAGLVKLVDARDSLTWNPKAANTDKMPGEK